MHILFEDLPNEVSYLRKEVSEMKQIILDFLVKQETKSAIMSLNELVDITGYTKGTIYQLVHQNKIPFHKTEGGGRKLLFYRSEIEAWLKGKKAETSDEFIEKVESQIIERYKGGIN